MNYLSNIPTNARVYGLNKLLVVRDLVIDWKHRDTELFLRNPKLLSSVKRQMKLEQVLARRSNQLRYIHHISRKILFTENPQDIVDYPHLYTQIDKVHVYSKVYIDFASIFLSEDKNLYKRLNHKDLTVFCLNNDERSMITYFIKKGLPLPKQFRKLTREQLVDLNTDHITSLFIHKDSITLPKKKLLWSLGVHLYQIDKSQFKYVTFKTDTPLPKGY